MVAPIVKIAGLTISVTISLLLVQLWSVHTDQGVMATASIPPRFVGWSGRASTVWFALLLVWCLLAFGLGLQQAVIEGKIIQPIAYVATVPAGAILFHRIMYRYLDLFWPEYMHDMVPTWVMFRNGYTWELLIGVAGMAIFIVLIGRWLKYQNTIPHTSGYMLAALWLGTFFAEYLRFFVVSGQVNVPSPDRFLRNPSVRRGIDVLSSDLSLLGRPIWYATIAAVFGWMILSGLRMTGYFHDMMPGER